MKKMQRALLGEEILHRQRKNRKESLLMKLIEIAAIGGVGFHRYLQRKGI